MRLIKYLTEDDNRIDIFKTECSQWIKESGGLPVFRGLNRQKLVGQVEKFTPRSDRRPRDTDIDVHRAVDGGLNDRFGWKPRSEGVFVTGDRLRAMKYGWEYIILPTNGYKYIWSPKVEDLYVSIYTASSESVLLTYVDKFISLFMKDEGESIWARDKAIKGAVKTYTDTNLQKGIKSGNEIIIKCDNYYAIDPVLYDKIKGEL